MKKWVALLRSGEFRQTDGYLEDEHGYCCLGVFCNLALVEGVCDYVESERSRARFDGEEQVLPRSVQEWAGLKSEDSIICSVNSSLASLNDNGASFKRIANLIEKEWKEL